jgi:hypothetical protein
MKKLTLQTTDNPIKIAKQLLICIVAGPLRLTAQKLFPRLLVSASSLLQRV